MEAGDVYLLRKRDAFYRSYVGPIVDFFAAQLFASPFSIRTTIDGKTAAPDLFYGLFREDCDLNNTDLTDFMKARFLTACVKGSSWWLVEMPDDEGLPAESRIDWAERDLGRARLCPLEPENVLDWETDEYGQLTWAITYKKEMRRDDPRLERTLVTETWKVYDRAEVETFQVTYDPKKKKLRADDEIPSVSRVPHRFPRVPLVQLRLPEGLWILNRTADAQIEHFRLSSAMSWAIKRTCYPMLIFKSVDPSKPPQTGAGYALAIDVKESFEWISPTTAAFDVLDKQLTSHVTEIYRISQQMAHSVDNNMSAAIGRSGESKAIDNQATEICLHAYGDIVREAIEATFELVSDGREEFEVKFSIEGLNKFSLNDITIALANLKATQELGIRSDTLRKELAFKAADMLLPDAAQQIKDQIRAEIEEPLPEPAPAPPTGNPTGGNPPPDAGNDA